MAPVATVLQMRARVRITLRVSSSRSASSMSMSPTIARTRSACGTDSKISPGGGPSTGMFASRTIVISAERSGLVVVAHGLRSPFSNSLRNQSPYWKSKRGG